MTIELTYRVDESLAEGEARIHPDIRLRIAQIERYFGLCPRDGFRIGRGDRFMNVVDDPACDPGEIRVNALDHRELELERASISEDPLPQQARSGLSEAEKVAITFLAITRNVIGEETGSGPLLERLQGWAAAGRLRAFAEAVQIYLGLVPVARGFISGRLAGIITTKYLAGYLRLDPQRLGYWLRHNKVFYGQLVDLVHSPLSGSFEAALDAVALLVELGT